MRIIHKVQWRHQHHCYNTPPCWRYSLCEQKPSKIRKSDIAYAKVIRRTCISYAVHNYHKSFRASVCLWRNTDV